MKTDDYVKVESTEENCAEIIDTPVSQEATMQENNTTTNINLTQTIQEFAENVYAEAIATSAELGLADKYEAAKAILFGTMALATGQMEQCLTNLPNTPKTETATVVIDLVKATSVNQVIKADDAIKTGLKLEASELEVAAAAKIISKATAPHAETKNKWTWSSLTPF